MEAGKGYGVKGDDANTGLACTFCLLQTEERDGHSSKQHKYDTIGTLYTLEPCHVGLQMPECSCN